MLSKDIDYDFSIKGPCRNGSEALVGIIGLTHSSPTHLSTKIAYVVIFPPFQHTHVVTHAVRLLLQYTLNLPSAAHPGALGLQRVSWSANAQNTASVRAAQRMGFKIENVVRWNRVYAPTKVAAGNGRREREGDPRPDCPGVDNVVLCLCWDDWEDGVKDEVAKAMRRSG